jgi:hypothetical protein
MIPPEVDTDLDRGAREIKRQKSQGIPQIDVAKLALAGVKMDEHKIAIGHVKDLVSIIHRETGQIFKLIDVE